MHSSTYGANWSRVAPHTPFIPLGTDGAYPILLLSLAVSKTEQRDAQRKAEWLRFAGSFDDHTCYAARPFVDPVNPKDTLLYYSGGKLYLCSD